MRPLIRLFFRGLRLVLAPIVLISEKLTTPRAVERSPEEQAEVDRACEDLALYQFRTCPFCVKVRKELARLALPIETRDAQFDQQHRRELAENGGRVKVPCLRIVHDDGEVEWLYESDDINAWLHQRFATA